MKYEVINLDTGESHGIFDSLSQARGCVSFDKLRAYQIWEGDIIPDGEFEGERRVENCEPYDGDDDRVKQGIGQWSPSELIR